MPRRISAKRTKSKGTGPSITEACDGMAAILAWSILSPHESHHLRGGPAARRAEARAADVLRLRRLGLMDREHLPRERGGLPRLQLPPARGGEHASAQRGHQADRHGRGDAD